MTYQVKISESGKIALPAALRRKQGFHVGQTLILDEASDGVKILSLDEVIARAQELIARHVPRDVSLADELSADRRAEAAGE